MAIYANGIEDIKKIYEKIGQYPDFIHVDIIDSSMHKEASDTNLHQLNIVKAYWPNHKIHTHIMSKFPSKWLNKAIEYSDIIYFHLDCSEDIKVLSNRIKSHNKIPGLVLHKIDNNQELNKILKFFKEILVLSVNIPGISGQSFDIKVLNLIDKLNKSKLRNKFNICVDGGIKSNLLSKFTSERIVSGSDVLNSLNPKRRIMRLQTLSRYEK